MQTLNSYGKNHMTTFMFVSLKIYDFEKDGRLVEMKDSTTTTTIIDIFSLAEP